MALAFWLAAAVVVYTWVGYLRPLIAPASLAPAAALRGA
jgi:hypothetical protein